MSETMNLLFEESFRRRKQQLAADRLLRDDKVLRQSPPAWREGYQAGQHAARCTACPYAAGTDESWSWSSGYIEGKAARS